MSPPNQTDNAAASGDERQGTVSDALIAALRPKLHRYCARMTGSVIDGEDVLQDALVKAVEAAAKTGPITNPEGWLFRIAHNTVLDHLRQRARREAHRAEADLSTVPDPTADAAAEYVASAGLRLFMQLPVAQRGAVILKDVLGYSLDEVCTLTDGTLPAVKAALHRGRARIRELAARADDATAPSLSPEEHRRLSSYIDSFNARDFDRIRDMLADDVKLDLVSRLQKAGRAEVAGYFGNYDRIDGWRLAPGTVEGRPAALVWEADWEAGSNASTLPAYFILLDWRDAGLTQIRDFRYARYVMPDADIAAVG